MASGHVNRATVADELGWASLNLVTATEQAENKRKLFTFLEKLSDRARLPSETEFHVLVGPFEKNLSSAPGADINIFGLGETTPYDFIRKAPELTKSSCLFVRDSGTESALA